MVERANHRVAGRRMAFAAKAGTWSKAIPSGRDRLQSDLLSGALGMLLMAKAVLILVQLHREGALLPWFWAACGVSAAFAVVVWLLRAATAPAAMMGGLICLHVLLRQELGVSWEHTAVPSLLALFLLTFGATKFGRSRKEAMGIAEGRKGRKASQVLANLGLAGLFAAGGTAGTLAARAMLAACIAALAEATADTVSSEMGQALAGTRWGVTRSITTGRPVAAGTDGGASLAGSALGAVAAAVVVLVSPLTHVAAEVCVFAAACAGSIFDSLLGATLERKGWLGNDVVNFTSTVFAAALALLAIRLL